MLSGQIPVWIGTFKSSKIGLHSSKTLRNRVELYKYALYNHISKNCRRTPACKLLWFWQSDVVFFPWRTVLSSLVPTNSWLLKTENIIWKITKHSCLLKCPGVLQFINCKPKRRQRAKQSCLEGQENVTHGAPRVLSEMLGKLEATCGFFLSNWHI